MGTDTPIAVLSSRPRMLFDYFSQLFAQVTNPPLDAIREEVVTSLGGTIGPEGDLLQPECRTPASRSCSRSRSCTTTTCRSSSTSTTTANSRASAASSIRGLYPVAEGGDGLRQCARGHPYQVSQAIEGGARIVVLSDRESSEKLAPIPSLLLTSAVHHHLVREKTRTKVGLIVEAGDAREVHHMALAHRLRCRSGQPVHGFRDHRGVHDQSAATSRASTLDKAVANYIKAAGKGVLKVMSKMGISTLASYTGAQLFQVIGLSQELSDEYFTGLQSQLGGIGLDQIAADVAARHGVAYLDRPVRSALTASSRSAASTSGVVKASTTCSTRTRSSSCSTPLAPVSTRCSRSTRQMVNDQSERLASLRGLFDFKTEERPSISIDEVEPASEIVKRFSTGAMSYGSISAEAHETLAIAMNRLGGRSNSGEGGETSVALHAGRERRSASQCHQAGRVGTLRCHLALPDATAPTSRSRWRREPSPVRAASFRLTRCTRGWPRFGTPRLASG